VGDLLDVTGDGRSAAVERAVDVLRAGDLVVLPTDTMYGLAADAFSLDGTTRAFAAKQRGRELPLSVLVRSPKQLAGLTTRVPEFAERLIAAYWPGPLTLVLTVEPNLRWDIGATAGTVSVRMPLDEVALAVVRGVGPVAITGANLTGQAAATTAVTARERFGDAVRLYLDDGVREAAGGSTIVDLTRGRPRVLRVGSLAADEVLRVAVGELDTTAPDSEGDVEDAQG
jgi:L-threonylcarbamoyladenylate synthase